MAALPDDENVATTSNDKVDKNKTLDKDDPEKEEKIEEKTDEKAEEKTDGEKKEWTMMIDESLNGIEPVFEEPLASIKFDRFIELEIDALPIEIFERIWAHNDENSFIMKRHKMRDSGYIRIGKWHEGHTLENKLDINGKDANIASRSESNLVYYSLLSKNDLNLQAKYLNDLSKNKQPKIYKRLVEFETKVINAPYMSGWIPATTDICETSTVRFWGSKRFLLVNWCSTSKLPYSKSFMVLHRYEFEQINSKQSIGSVSVGFFWVQSSWFQSVVEYSIANQTKTELKEYLETIQKMFDNKDKDLDKDKDKDENSEQEKKDDN